MHYYWFIGNGILRTSVAKNLKGSGRQILLKIPEVDNTISDKIGGGGRGGERRVSPPHHPSLFVMNAYVASSIGHWSLAIGYLILLIHNEPTSMICLSDQLTKKLFSTQLTNAQSNLHWPNDKNCVFLSLLILSLACRCANATRAKGWKVFGLQFYGECWSGENGETTFNNYGEADPKNCVQELVQGFPPCDKSKDMECVGTQSTNYIYRLKDCKSHLIYQ